MGIIDKIFVASHLETKEINLPKEKIIAKINDFLKLNKYKVESKSDDSIKVNFKGNQFDFSFNYSEKIFQHKIDFTFNKITPTKTKVSIRVYEFCLLPLEKPLMLKGYRKIHPLIWGYISNSKKEK